MKNFNLKEFLTELNKNEFVKACGIPLGYKTGYPTVRAIDGRVLLSIPYRKYKKTDKPDKLAVMPIEYVVSFELYAPVNVPESILSAIDESKLGVTANPAGFEMLRNNEAFAGIEFNQPVGIFPSIRLQKLGAEEYKKKLNELYTAYDTVINDMLGIQKASGIAKLEFKNLLDELIEPSLKPMYRIIDRSFAENYLD